MPGRKYSAVSSYRYGFNGKENDNEVKGEGNQQDYGERAYDPRIGRWLGVDPVQKKYPAWSPYNYAMNSPLKLRDDNGEDVIVTITDNTITFSSTIYITGPGATDVAKNANESFNEFSKAALQNRTYKDAEGKVYNVQIKMNFVAVNPSDPKDPNLAAYNGTVNDKVGGSGNNVLNLTRDKSKLAEGTRANAGHAAGPNYSNTKEEFIAGNGQVQVRYARGVGNMAWLNADAKDNGPTAIHETLHNFGLGDRYIENVLYSLETILPNKQINETATVNVWYPGFENDMMTNIANSFNQAHIDNLASNALELSKTKGNNFVMAKKVDNANNRDKGSAPKTFTRGKTTYTKIEDSQ